MVNIPKSQCSHKLTIASPENLKRSLLFYVQKEVLLKNFKINTKWTLKKPLQDSKFSPRIKILIIIAFAILLGASYSWVRAKSKKQGRRKGQHLRVPLTKLWRRIYTKKRQFQWFWWQLNAPDKNKIQFFSNGNSHMRRTIYTATIHERDWLLKQWRWRDWWNSAVSSKRRPFFGRFEQIAWSERDLAEIYWSFRFSFLTKKRKNEKTFPPQVAQAIKVSQITFIIGLNLLQVLLKLLSGVVWLQIRQCAQKNTIER